MGFGVRALQLAREVLHRVRAAGEAVAPVHREVLELGEVAVDVRIGAQLEDVEVELVVRRPLGAPDVRVGPAIVGREGQHDPHRLIVDPTIGRVNRFVRGSLHDDERDLARRLAPVRVEFDPTTRRRVPELGGLVRCRGPCPHHVGVVAPADGHGRVGQQVQVPRRVRVLPAVRRDQHEVVAVVEGHQRHRTGVVRLDGRWW